MSRKPSQALPTFSMSYGKNGVAGLEVLTASKDCKSKKTPCISSESCPIKRQAMGGQGVNRFRPASSASLPVKLPSDHREPDGSRVRDLFKVVLGNDRAAVVLFNESKRASLHEADGFVRFCFSALYRPDADAHELCKVGLAECHLCPVVTASLFAECEPSFQPCIDFGFRARFACPGVHGANLAPNPAASKVQYLHHESLASNAFRGRRPLLVISFISRQALRDKPSSISNGQFWSISDPAANVGNAGSCQEAISGRSERVSAVISRAVVLWTLQIASVRVCGAFLADVSGWFVTGSSSVIFSGSYESSVDRFIKVATRSCVYACVCASTCARPFRARARARARVNRGRCVSQRMMCERTFLERLGS